MGSLNKMKTKVPNEIVAYFHCAKCLAELPENESPQSYRQYDVGWTEKGFQVWCVRHECNIIHMDFEGMKHKANCSE